MTGGGPMRATWQILDVPSDLGMICSSGTEYVNRRRATAKSADRPSQDVAVTLTFVSRLTGPTGTVAR